MCHADVVWFVGVGRFGGLTCGFWAVFEGIIFGGVDCDWGCASVRFTERVFNPQARATAKAVPGAEAQVVRGS